MVTLLALFSVFIYAQNNNETPVSLRWNIDVNADVNGSYANVIEIVNNSNKTLQNNWVIYFCQFPKVYDFDSSSPISIELISGTYFKMYPNANFKALKPGEKLLVEAGSKRKYKSVSFLADGAFIVFNDNGVDEQPQNVSITYQDNLNEYDAKTPKGDKIYYPFGNIVFADNAEFKHNVNLFDTDIIPSLKYASSKKGKDFQFTKNVKIEADQLFSGEVNLLKAGLEQKLGCRVSSLGSTIIRLVRNTDKDAFKNDEHYFINIDSEAITIEGQTPHAIFNGVQTVLAMLDGKTLPAKISQGEISDYPDFKYRGIMLDVSRNFTTKKNLLKLIDRLASYKMDVLHLHLSDDEGWRVEIPGLEELTEVGARRGYSKDESEFLNPAYGSGWDPNNSESLGNGYYSRTDFVEILNYAKQRHITVVPEIDLPGHARAAIIAMNARYNKYKDADRAKAEEYLLVDKTDTSKYMSVQSYNDNVIDVALPSTYKFVNKVIDELEAMYEAAGLKMQILHIGGDEVPKGAWSGSPACAVLMKQLDMTNPSELKDYFVEQVINKTEQDGITIAGWQEIALKAHQQAVDERFAGKDILSYCWNTVPSARGEEVPYKLANAGFDVVLCNATNFYMDFAYSPNFHEMGHNWGGYVSELSSFEMQPLNIYQSTRRNVQGAKIDFSQNSKNKEVLTAAGRNQIQGLQGQLFTETIRSFDMVEYYLFPKMLGLAERAWNAQEDWMLSNSDVLYKDAVSLFNAKVNQKELPKLARENTNFRLAEPGIKIEKGKLYINSRVKDAILRYTTDGSEPTENSPQWIKPIVIKSSIVKAKAFYLGKESVTVILNENVK